MLCSRRFIIGTVLFRCDIVEELRGVSVRCGMVIKRFTKVVEPLPNKVGAWLIVYVSA